MYDRGCGRYQRRVRKNDGRYQSRCTPRCGGVRRSLGGRGRTGELLQLRPGQERDQADRFPSCIKLTGPPVGREVRKLAAKYHDIIIDTGGRDTASQRAALSVADVALVPFKPRSLDVWTLGQAAQMMEEAKGINTLLHAATFLNMADSRGSDNNEASEILRETDAFVFSGLSLGHRKAFSNAAANGLSVSELSPIDGSVALTERLCCINRAL